MLTITHTLVLRSSPIFSGPRGSWIYGLLFWVGLVLQPGARAETAQEYDLKAVLLYHLTQFVDWPADVADVSGPWIIGIVGRDPFGRVLDEIVKNETHRNRPIVVRRFRNVEALSRCHVLFVSGAETENLPRILDAIKTRPILSVSDSERFVGRGGMVQFQKIPSGKIQLKVDLSAVRQSGLTMSAKLLRVSEVISSPPP